MDARRIEAVAEDSGSKKVVWTVAVGSSRASSIATRSAPPSWTK